MAGTDKEIRRELGEERAQLAAAVGTLRSEFRRVVGVGAKVKTALPVAALGLGGLGATVRLLRLRRRR